MKDKKNHWLLGSIAAGVLLGGFSGWWFGPAMEHVAFLGDLFLNALKMMVIPLVFFSLVVGIAGLGDVRKLGRMGSVTVVYYLSTTLIAVIIGLFLVNVIQPGKGFEGKAAVLDNQELSEKIDVQKDTSVRSAILSILKTMVPSNIIEATSKNNVLPLILFALLFGGVLSTLGDTGKPVLTVCRGVNDAILKIVNLIMYAAPIGVFALVASKLGSAGGGEGFVQQIHLVAKYTVTVILGLIIHGMVILPAVLYALTRRNPFQYALNNSTPILTAFSTASSSATLPITIRSVQETSKIRREAAQFVLPLGATINMDGTALYEAVAAVFIGQAFAVSAGIQLGMTEMVIIALTATLAAIGAAGIPEAGLVTMLIVLTAVHFPPDVIRDGLATILVVDWFLDRCRTSVNVWGDIVGAAVAEKWGLRT